MVESNGKRRRESGGRWAALLLVLCAPCRQGRCDRPVPLWTTTPAGDGAASWKTAAGGPWVPRWRLRLGVATGAGGALDGTNTGAFPSSLSVAVRVSERVSLVVEALGVLSGHYLSACDSRANAFVGAAGARVDFGNRQGGSWMSPFVEAHVGGGVQPGSCRGASAPLRGFASGGGSVGVDVWMGRAAVSIALAADYLPTASPLAALIGFALPLR